MKQPEVDIVSFGGGIDLTSSYIELAPGRAIELLNFEPRLGGGVSRVEGCERGDGRAAPSSAAYYTVVVADSSGISAGDTLTGDSSGTTAEVVGKDDTTNTLAVTELSGTYTLSEAANGTTVTAVESLSGASDPDMAATWQLAAEDYCRDLIGAVPGSGNVLGAFNFGSTWYAFRYDGSTGVDLYKSSASGWTQVDYYHVLFFDTGSMAEAVAEGTSITGASSSASGTVKRFVKNSGSYGSTAGGYMVVDITSGGPFTSGENIQISGPTTICVATANSSQISFANSGAFQFIQHNFYGSTATQRVYGCDGVNPAFEFDGDVLTPIYFPGATPNPSWNTPTYIESHSTYLFLAFPTGQIAHSSIGEPLVYSALLGAGEFGLGDSPTGMVSRAGAVLAIYTRNKVYGLYGKDAGSWELKLISETSGAIANTVQGVGRIFALDDKGITPLDRVQNFGDFESATVSRLVQTYIDTKKTQVVAATSVKKKNQYRLFFSDGYGLIMTDDAYLGDSLPQFSRFKIPFTPTCVSNFEDSSGEEVILVGDSDGYVYQFEKSYNWDGAPIEFAFRTVFMHQKAPHYRKRYKRAYLDISSDYNVSLNLSYELSSGDYYTPTSSAVDVEFYGGGGFYSADNWSQFNWDAQFYPTQKIPLSGYATNISFLVYGNSATIKPFTIQTLKVQYLPTRLEHA